MYVTNHSTISNNLSLQLSYVILGRGHEKPPPTAAGQKQKLEPGLAIALKVDNNLYSSRWYLWNPLFFSGLIVLELS